MPLVAWKAFPGLARIQPSRPGEIGGGDRPRGFTTSTLGVVTANVMGANSRTGS